MMMTMMNFNNYNIGWLVGLMMTNEKHPQTCVSYTLTAQAYSITGLIMTVAWPWSSVMNAPKSFIMAASSWMFWMCWVATIILCSRYASIGKVAVCNQIIVDVYHRNQRAICCQACPRVTIEFTLSSLSSIVSSIRRRFTVCNTAIKQW